MHIDVCALSVLTDDEKQGWRHLSPSSMAIIGMALEYFSRTYLYSCAGDDDVTPVARDWMEAAVARLASEVSKGMIGVVLPYAGTIPDDMLPCDGTRYHKDEYPELYAVLDPVFRVSDLPDYFETPFLPGRTVVCAGNGTISTSERFIGDSFGEESHMQQYAEIFPHNHQYVEAVPAPALEGAGVPLPTGLSIQVGYTGVTPDVEQQPMNVVQPSFALPMGIVCR